MSFIKKLFGIKKKPENVIVNVFGKDYSIDVSAEAQEIHRKKYELEKNNRWIGSNEVESISEHGVLYKRNRVSLAEREQVGIYGLKWFSENSKFCVVYLADDDVDYNIALVNVKLQAIIYKGKLQRPHRCRVTNEGIVICEDWGSHKSASCSILVLDLSGNKIVEKKHNTGIGNVFELYENEKKFRYSMNQSRKIINIEL